ncbi:MAG TPA: hypothetical protein PLR86_01445, partial [Planctomycetota bacterium]|nr:hypothetical protein [Planctomycetota bacterium]
AKQARHIKKHAPRLYKTSKAHKNTPLAYTKQARCIKTRPSLIQNKREETSKGLYKTKKSLAQRVLGFFIILPTFANIYIILPFLPFFLYLPFLII